MRFPFTLVFSAAMTFVLFWLMAWMVRPPEHELQPKQEHGFVQMVELTPEEEQTEAEPEDAEPPPPPPKAALMADALPGIPILARPTVTVPDAVIADVEMPDISVSAELSMSDISVKGLAAIAAGAGLGGNSYGSSSGGGFRGRRLIPISTARPQTPKYAYDNNIHGWVRVSFIVDSRGQVRNVKVIDSEPKGVFEAAAVESIYAWQYDAQALGGRTLEVTQRVEFDPKDYLSNW